MASEISRIRRMKELNEETLKDTDKDAPLEDKFDFLLETLLSWEGRLDALEEEVRIALAHRHTVGQGIFSGRGER